AVPEVDEDEYLQPPLWNGAVVKKPETGEDDLLPQAIEIVRQSSRASVSLLQRKLRIGYSRAARLIELLEEKGIVGPDEGPTKGRAVLATVANRTQITEHRPRRVDKSVARARTPRRRFEDTDDFEDWTEEDWEDLEKE
ncbi:MAG: DNA translocase FtsK, partial [Chloroflexota bacterium]